MHRVKKLLYNNYFLAFLFMFPFGTTIFLMVDKYRIEVKGQIEMSPKEQVYYVDLNHDGSSEKVLFVPNLIGRASLKIYDPGLRDQYNSETQTLAGVTELNFGDINGDGISEVLFYGEKDSAVFLNVFDYTTGTIKSFILDSIPAYGTSDYQVSIHTIHDFDNDGFSEVMVSVSAGMSLKPRALYLITPHSGKRMITPFQGSKLNSNKVVNVDDDPYSEILVGTFAYRNQKLPVRVTDSCTWLIVYDHQLREEFEPVCISCSKSEFSAIPVKWNDNLFIIGVLNVLESAEIPNKLMLFSGKGKKVLERNLENGPVEVQYRTRIFSGKNLGELLYLRQDGTLFTINADLTFRKIVRRRILSNCSGWKMDLNLDGKPEWLFKKNSLNEYIITDQDFRHPIRWEPGASLGYDSFSLKLNGQENPTYFVQSGTRGTEISFGINSLWYGQYGIFAGIWLFFYLLILLVSRIQKAKLRQQMVLEEQMNELQYRVITSQFSPHYTFNVLNAISAKLYGAHPELYDYIIRFSRQLRYLYAGKNELSRTLREELEFCRDYLEIQKLRFSGKFDYDIHLSEEVSQEIIIPKMLIFTFVENALKHGLRAMETGGFIAISGAKEDGQIILQVTDNGIGRQAAKEYLKENPSYSTGKGLELLEKLVEQMNRVGKGKITWEMKDGEGERGTMVEITLHI